MAGQSPRSSATDDAEVSLRRRGAFRATIRPPLALLVVVLVACGRAISSARDGVSASPIPPPLASVASNDSGSAEVVSVEANVKAPDDSAKPPLAPAPSWPGIAPSVSGAVGDVKYDGSKMNVPVPNADTMIRSQVLPVVKRCYWKGLDLDMGGAGNLVIMVKIAPTGEVTSVSVSSNTGVSTGVVNCAVAGARRPTFTAPGPNGATLAVSFTFVKRGDGGQTPVSRPVNRGCHHCVGDGSRVIPL
jgi:hypothetical protein